MEDVIVGYLSFRYPEPLGCRERVVCVECRDQSADGPVPLYMVNLLPYKQTCHACKKIISQGRTPAWCELFPAAVPLV